MAVEMFALPVDGRRHFIQLIDLSFGHNKISLHSEKGADMVEYIRNQPRARWITLAAGAGNTGGPARCISPYAAGFFIVINT